MNAHSKIKGQPHHIDIHVGGRVKQRRLLRGMSQEQLGSALGLTFQQVQKYEKGTNRISASRLWEIARILGVPISFFYEGLKDAPVTNGPAPNDDAPQDNLGLKMSRDFRRIEDLATRRQLRNVVKAVADAQCGES